MGRPLHLAHHACLTWFVFHRDLAGQLPCPKTEAACPTNCLVPKEITNVFRCTDPREEYTFATTVFSNIIISYSCPKTTPPSTHLPLFSLYSCFFSCILWIKSSLERVRGKIVQTQRRGQFP